MEKKLHWEYLNSDTSYLNTVLRAKIPGGWLVFADNNTGEGSGLTFVPDRDHEWDGTSN
jgi:hypothetical protein